MQRIGIAAAENPKGPWERISDEKPLLNVSSNKTDWDSYITTNPDFIHDNEEYRLYYKAWDKYGDNKRKMGLATASEIDGEYIKYKNNPIISFKGIGKQVEDAYVYKFNGKYFMIMRDMGVYSKRSGLFMESDDGINWKKPKIAYEKSNYYFNDGNNRLERPQILMKDGKPQYLFLAVQGGKFGTSTAGILKIENYFDKK